MNKKYFSKSFFKMAFWVGLQDAKKKKEKPVVYNLKLLHSLVYTVPFA